MPTITVTDDQGNTKTVEVDNRTSYAAGLGIKERAKQHIDPATGKPYDAEVEIHKQLSLLEKAFRSVVQRERSG